MFTPSLKQMYIESCLQRYAFDMTSKTIPYPDSDSAFNALLKQQQLELSFRLNSGVVDGVLRTQTCDLIHIDHSYVYYIIILDCKNNEICKYKISVTGEEICHASQLVLFCKVELYHKTTLYTI